MNEAIKTLVKAIRKTIAGAKRQGTVGMSFACLKQNTCARGLVCSVAMYHEAFEAAVNKVAETVKGFGIY